MEDEYVEYEGKKFNIQKMGYREFSSWIGSYHAVDIIQAF